MGENCDEGLLAGSIAKVFITHRLAVAQEVLEGLCGELVDLIKVRNGQGFA